jgi:hypothetical protein
MKSKQQILAEIARMKKAIAEAIHFDMLDDDGGDSGSDTYAMLMRLHALEWALGLKHRTQMPTLLRLAQKMERDNQ